MTLALHRRRGLPVWAQMALLALMALVLTVAMNQVRTDPLPWVADFKAEAERAARKRGLTSVSVAAAMSMLGKPGVVFVDARAPEEFATGHVRGAKNLPQESVYGDLASNAAALGLPPDAQLVVYCGSLLCDRSQELAEGLRSVGFEYVAVMTDGYDGWVAAGGPTGVGS